MTVRFIWSQQIRGTPAVVEPAGSTSNVTHGSNVQEWTGNLAGQFYLLHDKAELRLLCECPGSNIPTATAIKLTWMISYLHNNFLAIFKIHRFFSLLSCCPALVGKLVTDVAGERLGPRRLPDPLSWDRYVVPKRRFLGLTTTQHHTSQQGDIFNSTVAEAQSLSVIWLILLKVVTETFPSIGLRWRKYYYDEAEMPFLLGVTLLNRINNRKLYKPK